MKGIRGSGFPTAASGSQRMNDATYGEALPQRTKNSHSQRISDENDGSHTPRLTSQKRTANINRDPSGNPLGAAIWINADELDTIGIKVGNTESIEIFVEDGTLQIRSSEQGRN